MVLRLLRGKDGRLSAYAPAAGGIARWTETRPGGPQWAGPVWLDAPGLSVCSVGQGLDGYVHLVGLREKRAPDDQLDVDVVHATQYQTGRPTTVWHSLGTPHPNDWRKASRVTVVATVVGKDGAVHIIVRNAGGGISARRQDGKGKWSGWVDFKGKDVTEGLSAVATAEGRVEFIAPTTSGALRWYMTEPGGGLKRGDDLDADPQPGSVSGVETSHDTLTHYWRDAKTREIFAYRPGDGTEPISLGGGEGQGPAAVIQAPVYGYDCTVLAQHEPGTGRLAVAAYPTENEAAGVWWTPTGDCGLTEPALSLDGYGRVVLAALGPDRELRVARQKTTEPGLALDAWSAV
ncbi:hypothetical protein [Streptomyces zagrosensis]|uniref:Uncharacterized protein n=1 Tax=Streptomyces zagrosensis TaxID=1042984 RepID=A0A7W9QA89_9ACTN|nr:hypothetical protein [Streptomyces zagrosensis]MBB5936058.1 hypothetical protein [Streptomyces zagrosensis]